MTAQEWLDALKQQENAATPGPYILDGMYPIYSLGRGGLKDKTVACANSKFDGDYIVAACNSVPRLIDMIEYLAGRLCDENHGDNDFDGKIDMLDDSCNYKLRKESKT